MRENRPSGSEGGEGQNPFRPLSNSKVCNPFNLIEAWH
jgi:hypothetical protein